MALLVFEHLDFQSEMFEPSDEFLWESGSDEEEVPEGCDGEVGDGGVHCNSPAPSSAVLGNSAFRGCLDIVLSTMPKEYIAVFLQLVSLLDGSFIRDFCPEEAFVANHFMQIYYETVQRTISVEQTYHQICVTLLLGAQIFEEILINEFFVVYLQKVVEFSGLTTEYEQLQSVAEMQSAAFLQHFAEG